MPVTLSQARQNATDAIDLAVIDEFRTNQILDLLQFQDVVNPAGGGGTLTYTYTRKVSRGTAGFRALNTEYAPDESTTSRHSVDLKPLGGSFQVDRILAGVGPAATGSIALNMSDKIASAQAEFGNAVINGDSATDEDSFDGLSKALAGSSTEVDGSAAEYDWTGAVNEDKSFLILEALDDLLGNLDNEQGAAIIANKRAINKIKSAARRSSMYVQAPGPRGTTLTSYGPVRLIEAGNTANGNDQVIPIDGTTGATDIYAVRFALDGFHGVSTMGGQLVKQWQPDFTSAGAVKTGEVEMGPVSVALKKTKAAVVARGVRV
ncbi:major capsid protein [Brevibacterium aurantiacum]|uniref:Phage capsid protein n=1 Tax=Brevibacterium aurantiacum TaxID=273384 RepID=A0A556C3D1_BREAU|nr:phage capsid protein [Brevibacterium aurantiacum]TSI11965.1 phage capsid protein [Brevibacterium aurantiacum]